MREADLYRPVCHGAFREDYRVFKMEDGGRMKKPFDIVGVDPDGKAVAMEVKVIRSAFDLANWLPDHLFEPQQPHWLTEFGKRGALALVLLYHEGPQQMWGMRVTCSEDWERPMRELSCTELHRVDGEFRGWGKFRQP